MNKLPILAFALAPFVAMASPMEGDKDKHQVKSQSQGQSQGQLKVDKQKLQQATPVTAMMDKEVFSEDGREIGNVDDVVVSRDGKVKNFIVDTDLQNMDIADTEGDNATERETGSEFEQAEAEFEQGAEATERTAERTADRAETSLPGQGEMSVQPQDVKYDVKQGRVTVSMDKLQAADTEVYGSEASGEMRLSEVVGMEVNLQDEDSFGRVEDVMLSKDNTEVVALVVDNWDGFEKHRRALPIEQAEFNAEEEEITLSLSLADVEPLPEFNLDNYTEEGWDLADWVD